VDVLLSIPHQSVGLIQWGVVIGASLVAAIGDIRHRRIPNALTFPLLLAGLVWAGVFDGLSGLGESVIACLLLGAPYVLLFLFAGGGAGDAKLMAAIGTWLGLKPGVIVLLCVALAGGILALVKALLRRRLKCVLSNVLISFYTFLICVAGGRKPSIVAGRNPTDVEQSDRLEMPYGVAIVLGVCIAAAIVALKGTEWLRLW
jgi:prepilin peptidase CpaA